MKIYAVKYTTIDFGAYYGGCNDYYTTETKHFATKEKAENFVAEEIHEVCNGKDWVVKKANTGKIIEIEVE